MAIPTLALNLTIGNHCGVTLGKTLITLTLGCLTLGHIGRLLIGRSCPQSDVRMRGDACLWAWPGLDGSLVVSGRMDRAQPGSDLRFEPWTFHSPNQPAPPSLSFGLVRVGPCLQCTGPSVFPIRSQAVWKYFSKSHSVKSHSFLSFIHDIPHYTKIMKGSRAFGLQQNRTVCWKIFYKSFKL